MASTTSEPVKRTYVVWAPDYTDPDALSRRVSVREQHIAGVKQLVAEGFVKMGGPTSDPESEKMNGSMQLVEAESAAAVRAVVERDVYWTNNVWDKERLDIRLIVIPFNVR